MSAYVACDCPRNAPPGPPSGPQWHCHDCGYWNPSLGRDDRQGAPCRTCGAARPKADHSGGERESAQVREVSEASPLVRAVALHYEFDADNCCDPPRYSAECEFIQVCHECGQDWPCDTYSVATGGEPRPEDNGDSGESRD